MSAAQPTGESAVSRSRGRGRLEVVAGWSLLIAAVGIVVDAWASRALTADSPGWLVAVVAPAGPSQGSIGLIPAYLGVTVGMTAFLVVLRRTTPIWVVVLAAVGVVGMFTFWFSYPDRATFGGLGSVLIGVAVLALPGKVRFASPLWIASGVLGVPELVEPGVSWGPVSGFALLGGAIGVTGASLLDGTRSASNEPGPTEDPGPDGRLA